MQHSPPYGPYSLQQFLQFDRKWLLSRLELAGLFHGFADREGTSLGISYRILLNL